MTEKEIRDVILDGNTTVPGESYKKVMIDGDMQFTGAMSCLEFSGTGTSNINGDLESETKVSFDGDIQIDGHVTCQLLDLDGKASINGPLSSEKVDARGYVNIGKSVESEVFKARGGFTCAGTLKAKDINVKFFINSKARKIKGDHISIKKLLQLNLKRRLEASSMPMFNVDIIEGKTIHLEHTRARMVRGNNVTIGPGCHIDRVEYVNEFNSHQQSNIDDYEQVVSISKG